jgi:hypothetical protein
MVPMFREVDCGGQMALTAWRCRLPGSASQFYLELETTQASEIFADLVHNRAVQPPS